MLPGAATRSVSTRAEVTSESILDGAELQSAD